MDSSNAGQAPEGVEPHAWAWMSDEDRVSISDTGKALDTEIARVHDLAYDDGIRVLEADRRALRAVYDFGRASRDAEIDAIKYEAIPRSSAQAMIDERDTLREQLAAAEARESETLARYSEARRRAIKAEQQLAAAEAVIEAALTFDGQQTVDGVTDRGYLSPDEWRDEQIAQILAAAPSSVLAAVKAGAWDEGARYVTHDSTYTEMFDIPENPYRSGTEGSGQ